MPPGQYAKPPIVEAVIEICFETSVSRDAMAKLVRDIKGKYPSAEERYEVAVELKVSAGGKEPSSSMKNSFVGYKLTGRDDTDVILLDTDKFATVRLAPYCGWAHFLGIAENNFANMKKKLGYRKVVRLATRYVNRIDVPCAENETIKMAEYLLIEPQIPSIIKNMNSFRTRFVGSVPEIEGNVIVNAAMVPSPLIDHVALLLDIDLSKDQNIPQKDNEVWELITDFQQQKNELFEAFITDKSRELFGRA